MQQNHMGTDRLRVLCRKGLGAEDTPKMSQQWDVIAKKADCLPAAPQAMWPVDRMKFLFSSAQQW